MITQGFVMSKFTSSHPSMTPWLLELVNAVVPISCQLDRIQNHLGQLWTQEGQGGVFYIVLMEVEGSTLNVDSTSPQTGTPAWVRRQAEQQHCSLLPDSVQCDQLPRAPDAGTSQHDSPYPQIVRHKRPSPKSLLLSIQSQPWEEELTVCFGFRHFPSFPERVSNGGKLVLSSPCQPRCDMNVAYSQRSSKAQWTLRNRSWERFELSCGGPLEGVGVCRMFSCVLSSPFWGKVSLACSHCSEQ